MPTRSSAAPAPPRRRRRAPRKPRNGDRQRAVDREPLRHVADPQPRRARSPPGVRPLGPDQQPQQRALARAVRPDHRDDLARARARGRRRVSTRCPPRRHPSPRASISAPSRRRLPAAGAEALGLDHGPLDREARRGRLRAASPRAGRGSASRPPAGRRGRPGTPRMCGPRRAVQAAKAPEPLDPVREAVGHQEVERPVDHRRLAAQPRRRAAGPGARRRSSPGATEQRLQHEGPRRRQPQPPRRAVASAPPPAPRPRHSRWSCGRKAARLGCGLTASLLLYNSIADRSRHPSRAASPATRADLAARDRRPKRCSPVIALSRSLAPRRRAGRGRAARRHRHRAGPVDRRPGDGRASARPS